MQRGIIHVSLSDAKVGLDLEVPMLLPVGELAELICGALRWAFDAQRPAGGYKVAVQPSGQTLLTDKSLADQGLWDGTHLIFSRGG